MVGGGRADVRTTAGAEVGGSGSGSGGGLPSCVSRGRWFRGTSRQSDP